MAGKGYKGRGSAAKPIYKCIVCGEYVEEPVHCGKPAKLLLDPEKRVKLSKLMSALLRHIPWEAGLVLDRAGWVEVDELVRAIRERWRNRDAYQWVTGEHVVAVARLDPKGRFQVSADGRRIRASYGHSLRVELGYKPLSPGEAPPRLYHGTVEESAERIMVEGIKPMRRIAVHLTSRLEDAVETGARHGDKVVVLVVDTECLYRYGIRVYRAGRNVYLAEYVPPDCIAGLEKR